MADEEAELEEVQEEEVEPPTRFTDEEVDLSLNSLLGFTSSTTMKVVGQLGTRQVVVLVDSRASHSFLSSKVVEELGCPVTVLLAIRYRWGTR